MSKKWFTLTVALVVFALVLAACQEAEPETVEVTRVVTETVTEVVEVEGEPEVVEVEVTRVIVEEAPADEEMAEEEMAEGATSDVYRIALFEDPVGLNYWAYLGPNSSVWTSYVLAGQPGLLFNLSDQRFDFVPEIALEIPEVVQEGDFWTITVNMADNAVWNDGEPITAHDVVFTLKTCQDLRLTHNWPNYCFPDKLVDVEAVDDFTVKYTFNEAPSLGTWQAGVALAPILPEHFWGDAVAEAMTFVEGLEEPVAPEGVEDCTAEELSDADAATCEPYLAELDTFNEAVSNGRVTLYEADATGAPVAGGFTTDTFEPGAFVQRTINPDGYMNGAQIIEYDDGTYVLKTADGRELQIYGDAAGEEILNFFKGPYVDNVIFSLYGDQSAAFLALADGEVDYVLNPLGLARGLQEQVETNPDVRAIVNPDYGMYYMAFNMRKEPFNDLAFRQAVEALIDKEFVTENVLQGAVFPMYSAMPPGNGAWYQEVPTPYVGLNAAERMDIAMGILRDAGYTWDVEPTWDRENDLDARDLVAGEGLRMPNGELIEPFEILGPGPAYDPLRASFNQWISSWMRDLGIPVESQLTGFNTILDPVFVDANFDMYILGWSLGNVAFPDYFESFWHSRNDTAVTGNNNTPGYHSDEFDALNDTFMTTTDLEVAKQAAYDMQLLLAEDLPYIPLFYKQVIDMISSNVELPYEDSLGGIEFQQGLQSDVAVQLSQ